MKMYLNNAGAGLMSQQTYTTITSHLQLEQSVGAYEAAAKSKDAYNEFYINAASLINAKSPSEIAFVDSASRGWNLAIFGSLLTKGSKILTLSSEFGTNLLTIFKYAKINNCEVIVIPCNIDGTFDFVHFAKEAANSVNLIAISHAAAHGSIINPVKEIGELARRYNIKYIVDGCQSVGQIPVDVQNIGCDMYITTGRKWLCGPRGTGFVYLKEKSEFMAPQIDLASADLIIDNSNNVIDLEIVKSAKQFELWERSHANMYGLSIAIHNILNIGIDVISASIIEKSNLIRSHIVQNNKFTLIGTPKSDSGIIGFILNDAQSEEDLKRALHHSKLLFSTMSDWDCPLHFPKTGASCIFRFSPHYYTELATIDCLCKVLESF